VNRLSPGSQRLHWIDLERAPHELGTVNVSELWCVLALLTERCGDAGFTVQVPDLASQGVTLVVADPFGRRLSLLGLLSL
jgi:hypothetical protein